MDAGLKQRLIGAAVLVALAVIFLPMLVKGPAPDSGVSDLSMRVPDAPQEGYKTVDLPLVVPPEAPSGGVLAMREPAEGDRLPVVDTATASPDGDRPAQDAAAQDAADPARPEPAAAIPQPEPDDAPAVPPAPATTAVPPAAAGRLPATVAGGDYVVHFGAFSSERDAQLIVRQLDGAGLVAYAEPFTLNGRPAQRVRLGPYASREAAEAARVRAARVRDDVTPRVVALDAGESTPPATAQAAARPPAPAPTPKPSATQAALQPAAAPAVAAAGVGFAVQVGAFSKAADATRLRDRLRGLGMTAFTDTVDTDKGRLTRVKAGPVPTREDAERLKSQLKSRAGLDGIVRAHP